MHGGVLHFLFSIFKLLKADFGCKIDILLIYSSKIIDLEEKIERIFFEKKSATRRLLLPKISYRRDFLNMLEG